MKKCTACKDLLDESEFNKDASRKDGFQDMCRNCQSQHYYENRDHFLQKHAEYRNSHKVQRRQYQRRYDAVHKKEKRIRDKEWQRQNPERCRAKSHRRRARVANLPADLTWEEWQEILAEYNFSCAYCGVKSENLQQEHMVPTTQGGGYTKNNIVPACPECNYRKGNRTPEEAGMQIKRS